MSGDSSNPPLRPADFHILLALAEAPCHGYGLMKKVEEESAGEVRLELGSLYRLLGRMLDEGLIAEAPKDVDPRRRYYQITVLGSRVLKANAYRLASLMNLIRTRGLLPGGEI